MDKRPEYEKYGIQLEEQGETTHVFKDGVLIGSYTIDIEHSSLKFSFPNNDIFNFFAYVANDPKQNRVQWVNENLRNESMDALQAGVAFLGFAKFEEVMQYELAGIHKPGQQQHAVH